jgi:hypothetical protein
MPETTYNLELDADQINEALKKVHGADPAPMPGSTDMAESGGVWLAINDATPLLGSTPVTGNYVVLITDRILLVDDDQAASTVLLSLPAAAAYPEGERLSIKKIGTSFDVSVDGAGSETIDKALTALLTKENESITIFTDGTNWYII